MNKNTASIALQAWNEHVNVNAEPEDWMAGYIHKSITLTVETCINLINNSNLEQKQEIVNILTKHFEDDNEKRN